MSDTAASAKPRWPWIVAATVVAVLGLVVWHLTSDPKAGLFGAVMALLLGKNAAQKRAEQAATNTKARADLDAELAEIDAATERDVQAIRVTADDRRAKPTAADVKRLEDRFGGKR